MKGTELFKDVIQNYLETRASYDELFAENFRKEIYKVLSGSIVFLFKNYFALLICVL